jgi:MFS family permease
MAGIEPDDRSEAEPGGDDVRSWLDRWRTAVDDSHAKERDAVAQGDPAAALTVVRRGREFRLLALEGLPDRPPERLIDNLRQAVRQHDGLVDALLSPPRMPAPQLSDELGRLQNYALEHIKRVRSAYDTSRSWATAAAVAGLLALAVGWLAWRAGVGADQPLLAFGWLGLIVVGLGLAMAMVFTYTAMGHLSESSRLRLTVLPAIIVLAVAVGGLLLPRAIRPAYVGTGVVAALVVLIVLAAAAIARAPERAIAEAPSPPVPFPPVHLPAEPIDRLSVELRTAESVVSNRSRREQRSARRWRLLHYAIGGAAALTSGAAGVVLTTATQNQLGGGLKTFLALLAIAGGGLTALATTLDSGRRGEAAELRSASCEALAREIGVMTRWDLTEELWPEERAREALEDVLLRYEAIVGVTGRNSFWSRLHGRSTAQA